MIPKFLIGYAVFCIVVIFVYLKFDLHLNDKYKVLIDLSIALFGFLTIFILIQQQNVNDDNIRNQETQLYNGITNDMFTNSLDDFILNKDIQYFYNELYHNKPVPDGTITNPILEEVYIYKLLAAYGNYAAYYYSHITLSDYKKLLKKHNYRAKQTLKLLLKSDKFKTYLNSYMKDIAGLDFIQYLKEELNYLI
jgi:hypothetical protein